MIVVNFVTEEGRELSVSGTIVGEDTEILISFFGYQADFALAPIVVAMQNEDKPGIIGKIATKIGDHNININAMHWGVKPNSTKAQSFLAVSEALSEEVLGELRAIDGVLRVTQLSF